MNVMQNMAIFQTIAKLYSKALVVKTSRHYPVSLLGRSMAAILAKAGVSLILMLRPEEYRQPLMQELAQGVPLEYQTQLELIQKLCQIVRNEIHFFPLKDVWLLPIDVLRYGIGDCKNKAVLLVALLREYGFDTRVVVGSINRCHGTVSFHAWVKVKYEGQFLICDVVTSAHAQSEESYQRTVAGYSDLTREYILAKAAFLGGALRYLQFHERREVNTNGVE
jgi:transglutaminase-like putative cysteine protease